MATVDDLSNISDSESFDDSHKKYNKQRDKKIRKKHSKSKRSRDRRRHDSIDSDMEEESRFDDRKHSSKYESGDSERKESNNKRRKTDSLYVDSDENKKSKSKHKHNDNNSDSDDNNKHHKSRHRHSKKHKRKHKSSKGEPSRSGRENIKQEDQSQHSESPKELHPSLINNTASKWENEESSQRAVKLESRESSTVGPNNFTGCGETREASFNENQQNGRDNNRDQNSEAGEQKPEEEKSGPNLGLSGKLTEDANTYKGVVIKYSQPSEARKPKRRWRWYIFRGDDELPFLPIHRQSAYLIGRERKVVDIATDHPSCSKQHAVLQYRLVRYTKEDGSVGKTVRPYVIDLESANGTYVNNRRITPRAYVELLEKDVVKFGYSSREYVLLHETSKGSDEDTADGGLDMSPVSALLNLNKGTAL